MKKLILSLHHHNVIIITYYYYYSKLKKTSFPPQLQTFNDNKITHILTSLVKCW